MGKNWAEYNFTQWEEVTPEFGLIKCTNGSYNCVRQTDHLDDWLGPWISFLWLLFLLVSIFSTRMIYKTFITFRDTLTVLDVRGERQFKEDCIYEHETAFACWNIAEKPVIKKCKIIYFAYSIPLLIAWSDLFLDISYISSFVLDETRMISPFIEVKNGIFIVMGFFDILGTFRIFLCGGMLYRFSQKLYTQDEKLLARLETHMEMVVVAFAFILEDFGELFIEYFCVEKYITGYKYEEDYAQSYMAAVSSISLNLIALACFIGFVQRFRTQQSKQSLRMNILSVIIPLFELVLSSLRTYRFIFQAFRWKKFRPGCVVLATNEQDEDGVPLWKAYQNTFSKQCFRPLDWIMIVLMCIYCVILIIFVFVYITRIRPEYELEMKQLMPDNLIGDPKKLPSEMKKFVPLVGNSNQSSRRQSKKSRDSKVSRKEKSIVKSEETEMLNVES